MALSCHAESGAYSYPARAGVLRYQAAFSACSRAGTASRDDQPLQAAESHQQDEEALQEAALRQAFAEQQSQRYGEEYPQDNQDDEQALQEAALRQAFAEQQQARYGQQEPVPSSPIANPVDTRNAFSFSPMDDLVDDSPSEPLFTLSPQLEERIEQQSEREDDVPFGQFEPAAPAYSSQTPAPQPAQPVYQQPAQPAYQQAPQQQPVQQQPPAYQQPVAQPAPAAPQQPAMDSLIHPFLMRNDMPLQKPTTPLPTLDLLTEAPKEVEPVDSFALEQKARLVEASLADYR
ncbi:DNA translocase FtsK [Serratia plymuthica]|uniref:DNA translocase FtsK n=1 Tax=Serratia plymuthica TaxID=82996 RepID=A0A2X4XI69_SERPL|nr:DNA translocase FtsK [Serratia plymuthica]